MMYLRNLLTWSQRLTQNKKRTLITAFILCVVFETLAGIMQPEYSTVTECPYYIETIFILCQLGSLIFTIYFLSLVELEVISHIRIIPVKNSKLTKCLLIIIPVIITLLSFAVVLFIRGFLSSFINQITIPSSSNTEHALSYSFLNGCKSITLDYYISRVFQLGDASENGIVNVIDHILRYVEPGLIGFNIYYILANPLSQLTEDTWMTEISCNPSLVRKMEIDHKELNMHLQNVYEIKDLSAKHKVALVIFLFLLSWLV